MKNILHSGEFLDYDGNTIRVTFYTETHLWVSTTSIYTPYTGGDITVEVWSDAGRASIKSKSADWVSYSVSSYYTTKDGYQATRYKVSVQGREFMGVPNQKATLDVGVNNDSSLTKTITITRA